MLFDKNNEINSLEENFDIELEDVVEQEEVVQNESEEQAEIDAEISDEELKESILFDDDSFDLYESVCGETEDSSEIECQKSYEDMKKDAFAFGATNDQVDGMIDGELGQSAPDTVPDNVNILGANTDDFDYDESKPQDMDDDEDIDIVIDDDDIYDSDDK